jgi:hypothetical protein
MEQAHSTYVVFEHPACTFDDSNNVHKVIASRDIKEDTILLVEHVYHDEGDNGTAVRLTHLVQCDSRLYNSLYPRTSEWTEDVVNGPPERVIYEKLQKNVFKKECGFLLGERISWFNHSLEPNCYSYHIATPLQTEVNAHMMCVIALRPISAGEELCICYSPNIKFVDGEPVDMGLSLPVIPTEASIDTKRKIHTLIREYMKGDVARSVIIIHISMYYGLYLTRDMMCPTERFIKFARGKFKEKSKEPRNLAVKWLVWLNHSLPSEWGFD